MARKRSTNNNKGQSQHVPQKRIDPRQASASQQGILDDYAKRDIVGILFITFAVVLMLVAVLPADDALVTGIASNIVHLVFGVGCYILPVFLAVIGATFLYRSGRKRLSLRAALGLGIIFIALLAFISLFAPIESLGHENPNLLFVESLLKAYGGYVGAGIAWCGITLFGKVITGVVLAGCMIIGVVIIGFSISKLIESIRVKHAERAPLIGSGNRQSETQAPPFARIRRAEPTPAEVNAMQAEETQEPGSFVPLTAGSNITRKLGNPSAKAKNSNSDNAKTRVLGKEPSGSGKTVSLGRQASRTVEFETPPLTRKLGAQQTEQSSQSQTSKASVKPKAKADAQLSTPRPQDGFELPSMSLLAKPSRSRKEGASDSELSQTADLLQQTLEDFGVMAKVVGWVAGPTVTLFKVDLPAGVRVSRVTVLGSDIALALAAPAVRIFAPIPGTNYVGIEVPNKKRQTVFLSEVLKEAKPGPLQIAIGRDVEGRSIVTDLAKMPHLLIGGTTGSGKSVSINAMIMSILMRATPSEVRFIMIDPKRVEFTPYNGIPHLYTPVVTEPKEAASALAWGVAEMERRLKVFSKVGVRNIGQYNAKVQQGAFDIPSEDNGNADSDSEKFEELPYIVIIIDELADLMMSVGKEVEASICRIAQLARAAGIHLIVATQRPSTNVVTGLIKSNITNRIAFNVASSIDSRVILDITGAEDLIGLGDLLFSKPELAKPQRIQGCYVSEDEISAVVEKVKEQGEPDYHAEVLQTNVMGIGDTSPGGGSSSSSDDSLVWEAADIVVTSGMGSTSNLQRRLKVGYARAGRIMDQLEEKGIVGPANGSRPREVLVDAMELETLKAFEAADE